MILSEDNREDESRNNLNYQTNNGAQVNLQNFRSKTSLNYASFCNNSDIVE
jgi:hypothetical protein